MAEIIRMPRMSDTMEEGNIVEWLKEEGDEVEPGDVLAEVETDKATMELESYHEGVLLHIGVREGAVPVNAVIAVIGEEGEDYEEQLKNAESDSSSDNSSDSEEETSESESDSDTSTSSKTTSSDSSGQGDSSSSQDRDSEDTKRIKASPLAKKMAEENDLSLSDIKGSGDQGRIVKRDIEEFIEKGKSKPAIQSTPVAESQESEDISVSQMRKTIARRLSESKFSAPHFYLTSTIDMTEAMSARARINDMADTKISFNDLVVKAAAMALRQHPMVNASWLEDKIRRHADINIGVAVAVEEGLLVPVIQNTDLKSLSQINGEVKEKAGRARERKLSTEEMQGNTFTISNLGMFDIDEFTAIINPPDACIMAVGSIKECAVVKNGELAVGHQMKVTLSCDHRIVDGVTGAKFLQTFKALLEEPLRMIV
jgi:pyruvate dehydrogenase E2 component (dihydrolipoamide acetyltransferase)